MTTLQGSEVTCTRPRHHSHSFCRPTRRTELVFLRALQRKKREGELKKNKQKKPHQISNKVSIPSGTPVGDVDADDAGLQQLPVLVGAGRQQPALVVRQAVAHEQDVVLLRRLAERLAELRLLVLDGRQDERRRVQAEAFGPLRGRRRERTESVV